MERKVFMKNRFLILALYLVTFSHSDEINNNSNEKSDLITIKKITQHCIVEKSINEIAISDYLAKAFASKRVVFVIRKNTVNNQNFKVVTISKNNIASIYELLLHLEELRYLKFSLSVDNEGIQCLTITDYGGKIIVND
jgi:hypothetical protein